MIIRLIASIPVNIRLMLSLLVTLSGFYVLYVESYKQTKKTCTTKVYFIEKWCSTVWNKIDIDDCLGVTSGSQILLLTPI